MAGVWWVPPKSLQSEQSETPTPRAESVGTGSENLCDLIFRLGPGSGKDDPNAEVPAVRGRAIACPASELTHLSGSEDQGNGDSHQSGEGVRMNILSCK